MRRFRFALIAAAALALPSVAPAALYTENFDVDPTANWTVNNGPSDAATNFFFDYSTVGIPSAPNSGGTTRGLKVQANQTNGIFSGVSVSPTGQNFTGDYTVRFDAWGNVNGPFPGGGSGSTQLQTFGLGTNGTTVQWPGGTQNSVWFAATGDGNSSSDWRAYSSAAGTSYTAASGVYAAGTGTSPDARNNSNPYYASFGNLAAPAAQVLLYPGQTGNTVVGSFGMKWHDVLLTKSGNTATWTVDGTLIATIDLTTVTLAGGNIFLGHSDTNGTSSTDPLDTDLLFSLFDNVRVEAIPEPGSLSAIGLAALAACRRRRSR